jgi:hypothetical protein
VHLQERGRKRKDERFLTHPLFPTHSTAIYTADCTLDPAANTANCAGGVSSDGQMATAVEVLVGYSTYIVPVTVTAGAEKLSSGDDAAATTGPAATTPTTLATTPAPTNSDGQSQTTAAQTQTTSTSTGGVPRVTQNAVIMGAAALVGGAMFL